MNLLFVLFTASLATTLIVVGLLLLLSFAALSFESPSGVEAVLKVTAALLAIYFFVRIGLSIWRDMRGYRSTLGSGSVENQESPEERER